MNQQIPNNSVNNEIDIQQKDELLDHTHEPSEDQKRMWNMMPETDPRTSYWYEPLFRMYENVNVVRIGVIFVVSAMIIVGIVLMILYFTEGMENWLYGFLGFVLTGIGLVFAYGVGMMYYIKYQAEKKSE